MYYNLRIGVAAQWKKFLLAAAVVLLFSLGFYHALQGAALLQSAPAPELGVLDYYLYIFKGEPAASPNPDVPYNLPTLSALLWLLLSFCVGNFPTQELRSQGENTLLRAKSRRAWWRGKAVWNAMMVLLYYAVVFGAVFFFAQSTGGGALQFNWMLHPSLFLGPPVLDGRFWGAALAVPVLSAIALTQMQITLSFVVGPLVSYILMLAYFVCSAYVQSPWLIANGLMLVRNEAFASRGVSSGMLLAASLVCWFVSYGGGLALLRRYPILKKAQE